MPIEPLAVQSLLGRSAEGGGASPQTESSPVSSDVNLFRSGLKEAAGTNDAASSDSSKHGNSYISDFLKSYQRSSNNAESSLQTASHTPTPANLMNGLREVSNFDLRARLLSKTVSGGVKGLDKLTSMQ